MNRNKVIRKKRRDILHSVHNLGGVVGLKKG